jgi:hypothetical protein
MKNHRSTDVIRGFVDLDESTLKESLGGRSQSFRVLRKTSQQTHRYERPRQKCKRNARHHMHRDRFLLCLMCNALHLLRLDVGTLGEDVADLHAAVLQDAIELEKRPSECCVGSS